MLPSFFTFHFSFFIAAGTAALHIPARAFKRKLDISHGFFYSKDDFCVDV